MNRNVTILSHSFPPRSPSIRVISRRALECDNISNSADVLEPRQSTTTLA